MVPEPAAGPGHKESEGRDPGSGDRHVAEMTMVTFIPTPYHIIV